MKIQEYGKASAVVCALIMGGTLFFAALTKIAALQKYVHEGFPSMPMLGGDMRNALALLLVSVELTWGMLVFAKPLSRVATWGCLLLAVVFFLVNCLRLNASFENWMGFGKGCGCFLLSSLPSSTTWQFWPIIRSIVLVLVSVWPCIWFKYTFVIEGSSNSSGAT